MNIMVVGFGNTLVGDDGCGLEAVRRLAQQRLPPGTRAVEGESDALLLPALWRGESQVWLIDALMRDQPPGSVYTIGHDELMSIPQRHGTAHQLSLPESLRWIQLVYPDMAHIRYFMWGLEPEHFRIGAPMSNVVRMAVDIVVDQVLRELVVVSGSSPRRAS